MPISDFAGFVVDSNENIYIGDSFYSIIQKYDKKGNFVESIRVENAGGKTFRMSIDGKNNIIIKSQIDKNLILFPYYNRDKVSVIYNANKDEKLRDVNKIFLTSKKQKFEDVGRLYPSIWKLSETKEKIVEQNFLLKFLSLPTMGIIILIVLIMKLTIFISEKKS
ncbi:hypothetical protein [Chryseobacterium sp. 3008163]|uniref:hypothetical protein n=1 Tax=Chryseobacterium sp. 3008163 TaxID=2478663 RepID=UPI001013C3ED|nr:hypothetical protein [Chryseobacterium sp. 3008163]